MAEKFSYMDDLLCRMLIAQIAGCDCLTKTPDINYHKNTCRYRVLEEARIFIIEQDLYAKSLQSKV